ncbi:MAG: Ger(x)C family spore germination protein [Deltaproteobacteria bacterium]
MKKILLLLLLLPVLLMAGCGTVEINKSSIPLGFGADYQNNKIIFTTQIANPSSPGKGAGEPQFTVQSTTGSTVAEAARRVSLSNSQFPLWSQSSLMLWGEDLARSDLALFMDFVSRNRFVRKNIPVVVTNGATVEEIFNTKPIATSYTAIAIKDLLQIQQSELGIYTPVTLKDVINRFATPGIEPVIPMITLKKGTEGPQLLLQDMAVFRDRRMVGTLNEKESRGYRLMSTKMIQGGLFTIPNPREPEKWVTLELSRSIARVTPQIEGEKIKIKIDITGEGNFYEQSGTAQLFAPETFIQLQDGANRELTSEISSCIAKAQALDSDIFGWGTLVHAAYPQVWKKIGPQWEQFFPEVESEVSVKFDIRRSYLTDRSFVFRE